MDTDQKQSIAEHAACGSMARFGKSLLWGQQSSGFRRCTRNDPAWRQIVKKLANLLAGDQGRERTTQLRTEYRETRDQNGTVGNSPTSFYEAFNRVLGTAPSMEPAWGLMAASGRQQVRPPKLTLVPEEALEQKQLQYNLGCTQRSFLMPQKEPPWHLQLNQKRQKPSWSLLNSDGPAEQRDPRPNIPEVPPSCTLICDPSPDQASLETLESSDLSTQSKKKRSFFCKGKKLLKKLGPSKKN